MTDNQARPSNQNPEVRAAERAHGAGGQHDHAPIVAAARGHDRRDARYQLRCGPRMGGSVQFCAGRRPGSDCHASANSLPNAYQRPVTLLKPCTPHTFL